MNIPKELQELRANVDILFKKYQEIRGQPMTSPPSSPDPVPQDDPNEPDENDQRFQELEDLLFQLVSAVHRRINGLEDNVYGYMSDHRVGHLPKIPGAEKMSACLKTLGLSNDYEVYKPAIFATASTRYGFEIKK